MKTLNDRIKNEKKHGQQIASNAGEVWNWETPAGQKRWRRRIHMLCHEIKPTMQVLELGCGTGYFSKELAKTEANITAIDISEDLLAKCQAMNLKNVQFSLMDAHHLSFPAEKFDMVIGSSVLHHLMYEDALKEVFRVLKPGGKIVFTEPNMMNPQIALQKNIPWLKARMGDSPDETAFFSFQLNKLLKRLGYKEIVITHFDFLHPAIPKWLIPVVEPLLLLLEKIPFIKSIAGSLYIRARK